MSGEAATDAKEAILSTTIRFIAMPADVTCSRRIARVNGNYLHALPAGFVLKILTELIERPTLYLSSLRFPKPQTRVYRILLFFSHSDIMLLWLKHHKQNLTRCVGIESATVKSCENLRDNTRARTQNNVGHIPDNMLKTTQTLSKYADKRESKLCAKDCSHASATNVRVVALMICVLYKLTTVMAAVVRRATKQKIHGTTTNKCWRLLTANSKSFVPIVIKLSDTKKRNTVGGSNLLTCPLSDAFKFLNRNRRVCAFGFLNKLFTDDVIFVATKVCFFVFAILQRATHLLWPCAACFPLCRRTLQSLAACVVTLSNLLDLCAGKDLSVRVGRQVDDAEVNSQNILRRASRQLFHVTDRVQVKVPLAIHKVNFTFPKRQQLPLVVAAHERDGFSAANCPQVHRFVFSETNNSIVVSNRTMTLERALPLVVQLISVAHFGNAAHDHLRREIKAVFRGVIGQLVQRKLFKGWLWLCLPTLLTNPIASGISSLKRLFERDSLLFGRLQFEIHNQLHAAIISQLIKYRELR